MKPCLKKKSQSIPFFYWELFQLIIQNRFCLKSYIDRLHKNWNFVYLLKYSSPHTFSSKTHNYFFLALFHLYKYSWPLSKIQMDAFLCYVSYRVMWVSKREKWYEIMFCLHYLNVGIWTYFTKICHFRSSSLTTNLKNKIPDILWQNWNLKWIRHKVGRNR